MPMAFAEPLSLHQEWLPAPILNPLKKEASLLKSPSQKKGRKVKTPTLRYGTASWYSETDPGINLHTANGEIFDDQKLTCASWDYPFGTLLQVTNLSNGKTVVCRVNDRGPNKRLARLLDLTHAAFRRIADTRRGLIRISIQKLDV